MVSLFCFYQAQIEPSTLRKVQFGLLITSVFAKLKLGEDGELDDQLLRRLGR